MLIYYQQFLLLIICKGVLTMKIRINYNLQIEVDWKKDDCRREPPHCHITRNGIRVAQVWLNPVSIESGHSLDRNEIDMVLSAVSDNRYDLEREYENNRNYGADWFFYPQSFWGLFLLEFICVNTSVIICIFAFQFFSNTTVDSYIKHTWKSSHNWCNKRISI